MKKEAERRIMMKDQISQYGKRILALMALLSIIITCVPAELVFAEDSALSMSKTVYNFGEDIRISAFSPNDDAWVGVYYNYGDDYTNHLEEGCFFRIVLAGNSLDNEDLCQADYLGELYDYFGPGEYIAILFADSGYSVDQTVEFTVRAVYEGPTWIWDENDRTAVARFARTDDPVNMEAYIDADVETIDYMEATCTTEGYEMRKATVDISGINTPTGETYFEDTHTFILPIDENAHDWDVWEVIEPATEETEGLMRRVCLVNSEHVQEQIIPRTNALTVTANDSDGNSDDVYVLPGGETTLTVHVSAADYSGITYRWYRYDYLTGEDIEITGSAASDNTYTVTDITQRSSYWCAVRDNYGNSAEAWFNIGIDNGLSVTANDTGFCDDTLYVLPGEGTTLTAYVTAYDMSGVTYRWYRSDPVTWEYIEIEGLDPSDNTYTVTELTKRCYFWCQVIDSYGNSVNSHFYVNIENGFSVSANDSGGNDDTVFVLPGEGTTLAVHVEADDITGIRYEWYGTDPETGEWGVISGEETDTLILASVTQSCYYSCIVYDRYDNSIAASFYVNIDNELSVRANDSEYDGADVFVLPGQGTTLTVHVSANDYSSITYKWYRIDPDTGEWFEITDECNDILTLSNVTERCNYACDVRDLYNNSASAWFYVYIDNAFSVRANDNEGSGTNVYIMPGEGTTLTAHVTANDYTGITYRWYKVDPDTGEWFEISGEETNTLTLASVTESCQYTCEVRDIYANSATAWFSVYIDNALSVRANDSEDSGTTVYVLPGEGTTFTAHVTANDYTGITYRWYKVDTDTWEEHEITTSDPEGNSLYLDCVSGYELYRCRVKDRYGNEATAEFYVRMDNALTVTANDNDWAAADVYLAPGEGTTLTAHANANDMDGITYRWYRIDTVTWEENEITTSDPEGNSLYLDCVFGYELYQCRVKDKYGNVVTAEFHVHLDNALTVTANDNDWASADVYLAPGEGTTLTAHADATDMDGITYRWYRIDTDTWEEQEITTSDPEGNSLYLDCIFGYEVYRCNVKDRYDNEVTADFYLHLDNALTVTANDNNWASAEVNLLPGEGTTLTAHVSANDYDGITYRWYRINTETWEQVPVETTEPASNELYLSDVSGYVIYRCIVNDKYGNEACADFYVRMDNALTVTANDNDWASADIDVVPGGSASLVTNVSARDMSGITYKWYKIDPINWGETQLTDTGNTLELTDVMERWNYRCDVSDGYGNTNSAYFYVRVNNGLYVRTNSSTAVAYGGEITLYAYASAYEMRGITYTWYSIDSGLGETLITGTDPAVNHITVSGITERCNYKCIVLDKYNNEVVTWYNIYIDNGLEGYFSHTGYSYGDVDIDPGEDVTLTVNITAYDYQGITYKWYRNDPETGGHEITGVTGNTLTLTNVTEPGQYSCEVNDRFGNNITLWAYVLFKNHLSVTANENSWSDADVYVVPGEDTTLTVHVTSDDPSGISYEWYGSDPENGEETPISNTGNTLKLTNVSKRWNYWCRVRDGYGNISSASFYVYVVNNLLVTDKKTGYRNVAEDLKPGDSKVLEIEVSGTDTSGCSIIWEKRTYRHDGFYSLEHDPNLDGRTSITVANIAGRTGYTCIVTDRFGNTSQVGYDLNVNHLKATANDSGESKQTIRLTQGDDVLLKTNVVADDYSGISYYWDKGYYDESGYNYNQFEPLNDDTDSINVKNVQHYIIYRCIVTDTFGSRKEVFFEIVPENHLVVSVDGKVIPDNGTWDISRSVKRGGSIVLSVDTEADDPSGITYTWKRNVTPYTNQSVDTVTVTDVQERLTLYCIVEDSCGNTRRIRFNIFVDETTDQYVGTESAQKINGLDSCFLVFKSGDAYCFTVVPSVSDEEITSRLEPGVTISDLYYWVVYRRPVDRVIVSDLLKAAQEGGYIVKDIKTDQNMIEYSIGIKLCVDNQDEAGRDYMYCTYKDALSCTDGPSVHPSFWFSVSGFGKVIPWSEEYFDIVYPWDSIKGVFDVQFDQESGIYTITPLMTKEEYTSSVGDPLSTTYALSAGLTYNTLIYSDTFSYDSWVSEFEKNENICGTGAGGGANFFGTGMGIIAWTENDMTFEAYGVSPSGERFTKTIRIITHAEPTGGPTSLTEPELKTISNTSNGVKIAWEKSAGATKYRVYRSEDGGDWNAIADVGNVATYTDKTAVAGTTYSYTVCCLSDDGKNTISTYDPDGITITFVTAPVLKSASYTATGVKFTWVKSEGATKYRVYRKSGDSGWGKIADVGNVNSYTDTTAVSGTEYKYTVRCLSEDGKNTISGYDSAGVSVTYYAPPVLNSASSVSSGITVSWEKVNGITGYRVYRKTEEDSSWSKLADVGDVSSYTDKTVEAGQTYSYTVRCLSADGKSTVSAHDPDGVTATFIAAPVLKSASNAATGVKFTWMKSDGATKYRVYRKEGSGSWKKLADVGDVNTYTDTTAVSGTTYSYTVRCLSEDGKNTVSGYDTKGKSVTYYAAPVLDSVTSSASGLTISWEKSEGATRYRVYRKSGDSGWSKIADVGDVSSYTDKTAEAGTEYKYTVRCLSDDGSSTISSYDPEGRSGILVAAPVLKSAANAATGVKVTWVKSAGAVKYRVYRKEGSGSWKKVADVGDVNTYTDTTAVSGTTYSYTVRCLSEDGKSTISGYDTTGKSVTYYAAPVLKSTSNTASGVTVNWEKSEGAVKYRVYRKSGDSGWSKIADVGDVSSYTDKKAAAGTTYKYTVRCLSEDGSSTISSYDSNGIEATYIAPPVLVSVTSTGEGVTFEWEASAGAENYRVFRKVSGGSWSRIGDTTDTTFTDTTGTSGTTYLYTVRCVTADGKSYTSAYDSKGLSVLYE